jgi:hypothetical protein
MAYIANGRSFNFTVRLSGARDAVLNLSLTEPSAVTAQILDRIHEQPRFIAKETKSGVAARAKKSSLTIGLMGVVARKLLTPSPLRSVSLNLAANVAAWSAVFCPLDRRTQPVSVVARKVNLFLDGVILVPPTATARAFDDRVPAVRKYDQLAAACGTILDSHGSSRTPLILSDAMDNR